LFSFFAVWHSQSEAQSSLFNLKGQPALLVIVGLVAALRVLRRKCCPSLFEIGIVGLHLNDAAMLSPPTIYGMRTVGLFQYFQVLLRFFEELSEWMG